MALLISGWYSGPGEQPVDAGLLHQGDHARMVDVSEGVHIRPADGYLRDEGELMFAEVVRAHRAIVVRLRGL